MRKHIAVIIALVMAFSLCGCGSSKSLFPENTGNKQQTKTADSGSIKVGYLLSSDGDAPDTVARVQGIRKMQEETGIADDQIIIAESVKKADCEKKAAELVEKGCDIIFAENPNFESILEEAAKKYPDVQFSKYNTATIKGNISELNLGVDYIVKAKEVSDSHGVGYDVINIKREKPTTLAATRNFLYEILTPNQTDVLLEAYPDIVDRIMNNRLDDIDLSRTKGIKDYTFNVIKNKVIENFKLAEIVEEFRGLFNLSTVKKLYDKYTSVDKIKEVIREEPYQCLCRLGGIGFKTADSLLLTLDKDGKECQKNGKKPVLFFGFDLITSYQRAKACVDYLLDENENNGNTYMHVGDLKKQFDVLVPEAKSNLPLILKGDNDVVFDRELLSVCKKKHMKQRNI